MNASQPETTELLASLSNALADAAARAGAATVTVNARRRFPASGIVYQGDKVLTADHVIEREEDIAVFLPDGSEVRASLSGRDPGSDLALLSLPQAADQVAEPAREGARIGQIVLALGRPGREGIQASLGVVSALGGPLRTGRGGMLSAYLRTDAIPYPGFSGGPLVNHAGHIVGINTSGLARGASLAIPVELAWQTAKTLAQHGQVRRGYLGVRSQPVHIPPAQQNALGRAQNSGLLLVGIEEASPAEQNGLLVGDILVALAGRPIGDPDELLTALSGEVVGQAIPLEVIRGGQPVILTVIIGERK
jgi:S1-C subfamily serine protease